MNFFQFPITDALAVWDSVKDVKDNVTSNRPKIGSDDLNFSFITPTILGNTDILNLKLVNNNHLKKNNYGPFYSCSLSLALGSFPDNKIEDLLKTLNRQPALLWNLNGSCKPLSPETKLALNNQLLDLFWPTPGHFSQAPSLSYIFLLCYSIKSWLLLGDDNIAVVHCNNGRSRTGILIACLLKYMGAFENASDAFDYFCKERYFVFYNLT